MSDSPYASAPARTPSTDGPVEPGSNGTGVHQQALTDRMAQAVQPCRCRCTH